MIKAIEDKVIVSEMKRSQTAAGILIPVTAVEPQAYGKILSIGEKVRGKELEVGNIIVYHKMGGQAISMNNQILCCVPYPEIYGILEDETTLGELKVIETDTIKPTAEANALATGPALIKSV